MAYAADAPDAANPPTDERPIVSVGPVVATATRLETPPERVASSVTVITAEELERRQYRLVVDALRHVPGVDVRRNGGPGTNTSVFLRGGDSDHVLVLIDGVELNDPSSPSRVPILSHLTTDDIERIEVVRGPQSSLYGGDAMSGVIQIFTKRGEKDRLLRVTASAEGGSYSTGQGALHVRGGSDAFDYSLSASHLDSGGFSARSGGVEDDPYRNTTVSGRAGWHPTDWFSLDGSVRFTDARVEFDGSTVEADQLTDVEQILARLAPEVSLFDGRWKQRVAFGYSRNVRDTRSTFPSLVEGDLYALDWQHDLQLFEDHEITLGIEHEWEDAELTRFDASRRTFAVYAQDAFRWGERWFGTVGLRFDDPDDFGSQVTYRLTGGVELQELNTVLRASHGTGFKAPSLSQLNPLAFGGNPALHPEESIGVDVGFESRVWDDRVGFGATFFFGDVDDLIVAVFDAGTSSFVNLNIDRSRALGVESFVSVELCPSLRLNANYTFTRTRVRGAPAGFGIEDGSRLLRRPTHKASADLIWSFLDASGELAANVLYVGDRRDLDPATFAATTAPSYATLGFTGRFRVFEWFEVFARVENVTDEVYEDVLGFATAGVSAYGGIRLRY